MSCSLHLPARPLRVMSGDWSAHSAVFFLGMIWSVAPCSCRDVNHSSTLNLAHTPNGLRLVQLDLTTELDRVERVQPELEVFEPERWGSPLLDPWYPVAATVAVGRVTLPPVRFCCRPDVLAFEGTEAVGSARSEA